MSWHLYLSHTIEEEEFNDSLAALLHAIVSPSSTRSVVTMMPPKVSLNLEMTYLSAFHVYDLNGLCVGSIIILTKGYILYKLLQQHRSTVCL